MELNNPEQSNNDSLFELEIDQQTSVSFREASKWVQFITITSFVLMGLFLLVLIFAGTAFVSALQTTLPGIEAMGGVIITAMIIVIALASLLTIMLYRFGTLTKQGIQRQDQYLFNSGLKSLKYYFMVTGILGLIGVAFSILSTIGTLFR